MEAGTIRTPPETQAPPETHTLTATGKGLDLSFLGKPHEHDPRRVYSTTCDRLAGAGRFRPPPARPTRARADDDGEERSRRSRLLRRRERALPDGRLPGELEEQHLHPLRGAAARRRADPVRDRRLGPRVREDRRAVAERQHPPGDHLEVGRDGGADDVRPDGAVDRLDVLEEAGGRGRAGRDRHLRPECRGRVRARGAEDDERLADDVGGPGREDARRDRVPEDLERRSATPRSGRSRTSG